MKASLTTAIAGAVLLAAGLSCVGQQTAGPAANAQGTRAGSKEAGITFLVPAGMDLYSEANPGPLTQQISAATPYILVNPEFHDENINIKVIDGVTDADLQQMKSMLDGNSNVPLPGYKRISVAFVSVGKGGSIHAVEHDFQMQGNVLGRLRSITFVLNGRGYAITCGTSVERFEKADTRFFQPFLDSIEAAK